MATGGLVLLMSAFICIRCEVHIDNVFDNSDLIIKYRVFEPQTDLL